MGLPPVSLLIGLHRQSVNTFVFYTGVLFVNPFFAVRGLTEKALIYQCVNSVLKTGLINSALPQIFGTEQ